MGTDRNLARGDKIIEYFEHLDEHSSRVKVTELGESTEGNPFLLAVITSAENLKRIERLREISLQLSHPQGLSEEDVEELVEEGKVFVSNTNSVHASEVGGTQMASELAFELATSEDHAMEHVRQNTVFLLIPSANPDGNQMVVDWYNEWRGTTYEGSSLPYLYHKYVGHDNNRAPPQNS
ncbi:MAG: hypothetical protein GWO20_14145 [Candidatus Korarchaeota archaeon]|nr:hypothetical protein [Candidatus Korarchaeota archaeon]NIU84551.1 hypothetical protein [Candidatus Thorarchaeota archaeon]NIW14618.1 hypothetical protein [Candidatus Thorarchaeota archaeon]NIW52691.1 hypothetical protein [Candidatus Korarchaeota archaeon]